MDKPKNQIYSSIDSATAAAIDILRKIRDEKCLVNDYMSKKDPITGEYPKSCMISCPCTRCNSYRM